MIPNLIESLIESDHNTFAFHIYRIIDRYLIKLMCSSLDGTKITVTPQLQPCYACDPTNHVQVSGIFSEFVLSRI